MPPLLPAAAFCFLVPPFIYQSKLSAEQLLDTVAFIYFSRPISR